MEGGYVCHLPPCPFPRPLDEPSDALGDEEIASLLGPFAEWRRPLTDAEIFGETEDIDDEHDDPTEIEDRIEAETEYSSIRADLLAEGLSGKESEKLFQDMRAHRQMDCMAEDLARGRKALEGGMTEARRHHMLTLLCSDPIW